MTDNLSINDLMRRVEAHGMAGELAAAERVLCEVLAREPQHALALHLLGVTLWQSGRAREALEPLRSALALTPERAECHYVLAKVSEETDGPQQAIEGYRQAVKLAPEFAPAWTDLGIACAETGAFAMAVDALSQARRLSAGDMGVAFALGQSLLEMGRLDEALQLLGEVNSALPDDASVAQALAVALRRAERAGDALACLQQAAKLTPALAELQLDIGNCLHEMGRVDDAIAAFQQALVLDPEQLAAHDTLNRLLFERGEQQLYLASYRQAIAARPQAAPLRVAYAGWLTRAERYPEAERELREAIRLGSAGAQAHRLLARAFANQGKTAAALEQFHAAVAAAPGDAQGRRDLARMFLLLGEVPQALEQVQRALAIAPADQDALACLGLCWRLLGDVRETQLNDCARFIRTYSIPVPAGFADIGAFNRELNRVLDALHHGEMHPPDQTLRGGTQTHGDLFARQIPVIQQLRESIEHCVRAYIADMDDDPQHPLLSRKSDHFRFAASWSCRLKEQGFHTNHVHPKGWISSCYYVSLPDVVKQQGGQQGWITFGESNLRLGEQERVAHTVQPAEGLLVLFPSYMFHGTVPFESAQARTTVAFDVVPE